MTNNAVTSLTSAINSTVTTVPVFSAAALPTAGNFRIIVDSEIMLVTAVSGTNLTVVRGQEGTGAASHSSGVAVIHEFTKGALLQLIADMQMYDAMNNLPTAERVGRIFRASDTPVYARDNGSSWDFFCYGWPVTPPVGSTFSTWVNQNSAVLTSTPGYCYLSQANQTGSGESINAVVKSLPSAPYTITIGFIPCLNINNADAPIANCGLVLRESSSGKMANFEWGDSGTSSGNGGGRIAIWKYNSPTSLNSTLIARWRNWKSPLVWFRIIDDNTNRIYQQSIDGFYWTKILVEARTTYITPDQTGFCIENLGAAGTNYPSGIHVVHHTITTP